MVAWISQWLQNIILIVLLATFADLLLPSSAMQKYSKMVLGLLIIVVILSPVLELFTKEYSFNDFIKRMEGELYNNQAISAINNINDTSLTSESGQLIRQVEDSMTEHLKSIVEKEYAYTITKVKLDAELQNQEWVIHSVAILLKVKEVVEPVEKETANIDNVVTIEINVQDVETQDGKEVDPNNNVNEELVQLTDRIEKELGLKKGQVIIYLN